MRAQNDVVVPAVSVPVTPDVARRIERGKEFERSIAGLISGIHEDAIEVLAAAAEEAEDQTLEALDAGSSIVLGGRLPTDHAGKRSGKPDLLVSAGSGGFRAVDVKHHITTEPAPADRTGPALLVSSPERPALEDAVEDTHLVWRKREDDLLQLAHYQRMLEAAGLAAAEGRWAGIIGVEGVVCWFDLDAPLWKAPSTGGRPQALSTMQRYDEAFALRLDVVAAALAHRSDPTVPLLVEPVRVSECSSCPWNEYCTSRLQQGTGDVSLVPRLGWRDWNIHKEHGVRTRADLAALDSRTARLAAAGVDVTEFQRLTEGLPLDASIGELSAVVRARSQLTRLEQEGITTFGGLLTLDAKTAGYATSGLSALPEQIDLARAALGDAAAYRRRGILDLEVPRADVEVDVDMENIEEGVYLWGSLMTVRSLAGASPEYRAWVTWTPLRADVERDNSLQFWTWLMDQRREAHDNGRSFRAYCYNAAAENTYLLRLGHAAGLLNDVTEFIRSDEWVDLLRVVDRQLITGGSIGLKAVAPLAGFHWGVDDPGGSISMLKYDLAVGADAMEREAARTWLLTYNQGDVEATLAIREWLESQAQTLPSVESLDPTYVNAGEAST